MIAHIQNDFKKIYKIYELQSLTLGDTEKKPPCHIQAWGLVLPSHSSRMRPCDIRSRIGSRLRRIR